MATELSTSTNQKISTLVQEAINNRVFPGIEILLSKGTDILFHETFGRVDGAIDSPKLEKGSIFDLASLTKPLATAPAIVHLAEHEKIKLDIPISRFLPEFFETDKASITIDQLLTHSSGLPDWVSLYDSDFDRSRGWHKLRRLKLESAPGSKVVYSCLGYIVLGEIVRRMTSSSLAEYCSENLYAPLGLSDLRFNPGPSADRIIPTAFCPLRQKTLRGIVHDENAFLFDGEGGNAGLFGSVNHVWRFCQLILNEGKLNDTRLFSEQVNECFLKPQTPTQLTPRTYGWDCHTGKDEYMSCGDYMPVGSVGHLGFTGTSIWMDPVRQIIVIMLSNRVAYSREENLPLMRDFRPAIHNLLLTEVIGP